MGAWAAAVTGGALAINRHPVCEGENLKYYLIVNNSANRSSSRDYPLPRGQEQNERGGGRTYLGITMELSFIR